MKLSKRSAVISSFRLKIAFTFQSDIILCSPLGLRMILDGDAGNESHLVASIQIAVIDKVDRPRTTLFYCGTSFKYN